MELDSGFGYKAPPVTAGKSRDKAQETEQQILDRLERELAEVEQDILELESCGNEIESNNGVNSLRLTSQMND